MKKLLRASLVACSRFLAVSATFLSLTFYASAAEPSEAAFRKAFQTQDRHAGVLMAIRGVVGVGTGLDAKGNIAIKVYTKRRGVGVVPRSVEGIPVLSLASGEFFAGQATVAEPEAADPTMRFDRPVPIGVSTGHPDITAGTIGCRVRDQFGNVFIVSNNHVLANENDALIGDNALQPGPFDGGVDPDDAIGTLFDFEPISFSAGTTNQIDAAIAQTSVEFVTNATPEDGGYGAPLSTPVSFVFPGRPVMKYGRTTELTFGQVDSVNAIVRVGYTNGVALFVRQIIVTPGTFSDGGDSGSLVVTLTRRPLGLLFAGSSTATIVNPIRPVLDRFNVVIDGD